MKQRKDLGRRHHLRLCLRERGHWTLLLLSSHVRLPFAVGRCSAGWAGTAMELCLRLRVRPQQGTGMN